MPTRSLVVVFVSFFTPEASINGSRLLMQTYFGTDGYPVENRGEHDTNMIPGMHLFTPEEPDISCFWISQIISTSSGIYWDVGYGS